MKKLAQVRDMLDKVGISVALSGSGSIPQLEFGVVDSTVLQWFGSNNLKVGAASSATYGDRAYRFECAKTALTHLLSEIGAVVKRDTKAKPYLTKEQKEAMGLDPNQPARMSALTYTWRLHEEAGWALACLRRQTSWFQESMLMW